MQEGWGISPPAKKKLFAVENKEVIISIWSSQGNKNSPGYIACNLQVDGIIHRFHCLIKIPNGGRFFPKQQLNRG